MLNLCADEVTRYPFPHVVKQGILSESLFARLRTDFPGAKTFQDQTVSSGGVGSRVGTGTGFDIYRGDDAYARLIEGSAAWTEFDAWINSPQFVIKFLELFGPYLDELGCKVDVDSSSYDRNIVERRAVLTEHKTVSDRLQGLKLKFFGNQNKGEKKRVPLFSRLDIEKSIGGYAKPPHCDRPNRLCSLIIYFSDLDTAGDVGGQLNIYAHKDRTKTAVMHERHPKNEAVDVVGTVTPKQNLGVFFPCSNNSYHGVNALESQDIERDFLYINISTQNDTAW